MLWNGIFPYRSFMLHSKTCCEQAQGLTVSHWELPSSSFSTTKPRNKGDRSGEVFVTVKNKMLKIYDELYRQGFSKDVIQRVLTVLPAQSLCVEAALDWLLLHVEAKDLPNKYAEQIKVKGEAEILHKAHESQKIKYKNDNKAGLQVVSEEEEDAAVDQGRAVILEEQQRKEKEKEEQEKASRRAWILQYAEEACTSSEESEEEIESEAPIEDWEIWGDPREVERRRAERSRESLPRESRLALIAQELAAAKEAATKAKSSGDKSGQRAAGQMIGQLKRELASLGSCEEELTHLSSNPKQKDDVTGSEVELFSEDTTVGKMPIEERDIFLEEKVKSQEHVDAAPVFDLFDDSATAELEDDPKNEDRRKKKIANLLKEARLKIDFDDTKKISKKNKCVQSFSSTGGKSAPKALLQQLCTRKRYGAPKYTKLMPRKTIEEDYRYQVSIDIPGDKKLGKNSKAETKSFSLPEQDDGWKHIEEAQNAAATFALLCLEDPKDELWKTLVPPFDELYLKLESLGHASVEEEIETEADAAEKEALIVNILQQKNLQENGTVSQVNEGPIPDEQTSWNESLLRSLKEWNDRERKLTSNHEKKSKYLFDAQSLWNKSKEGEKWACERSRLPVTNIKDSLYQALSDNDVVVISGETGSGKTTQIPQYILEHEILSMNGGNCSIICTQPRRIAAITVAERVAAERGDPPPGNRGSLVGYAVRLETRTTIDTRLLFCTTGILLRRLIGDPALSSASHIIVDEVHERTLQSDFLIALLRELVRLRRGAGRPLKVILMSATLDAQLLVEYFDHCPILTSSGRTFPVQQLFLEDIYEETGYVVAPDAPVARRSGGRNKRFGIEKVAVGIRDRGMVRSGWGDEDDESEVLNPDYDELQYEDYSRSTRRNLARIDETRIDFDLLEEILLYIHTTKEEGAVLVFLPGFGEISVLLSRLQSNYAFAESWLVPLHSSVSPTEQRKAFRKPSKGVRKIVIATNIAETSLTIDDVVYVVDTGKHKERRHDPARGMSLLVEDWVSKASAAQRRGRAGRVQEGICYSLFTRHRYEQKMKRFPTPEMQRVPLEELVLQVRLLCVAPQAAQFLAMTLQPPPLKAIDGALRVLCDVGALHIDKNYETLTPLGHHLAQLPVDVRLGKLLLLSSCLGCLSPALSIAACLAHKTPFLTSFKGQDEAKISQQKLSDANSGTLAASQQSDHLVMAAAVEGWLTAKFSSGTDGSKKNLSSQAFARKYCLSEQILKTIEEMRGQFAEMLADIGFLTKAAEKKVKKDRGFSNQEGQLCKVTSLEELGTRNWYDKSSLSANRYANQPAVLKAALLASLWPHIAVLNDNPLPSGQFTSKSKPDLTNCAWHDGSGPVSLHPSSICSNLDVKALHRPFVTYLEKVRTRQVFLRDCTIVSPASILLFGGDLAVDHAAAKVTVDGWIDIKASGKTAALIRGLRKGIDALLQNKIENPKENFPDSNGMPLLEAIVKLLTWEDAVAGLDI